MKPQMMKTRPGFSLVELILVLIIGMILMTFAVPSYTNMTKSRNAQNARDNLVWMAARARAKAIERGQVWQLQIDPALNRARVIQRGATVAQDSVSFNSQFQAVLSTAANTLIVICYSPRGFALTSCDANSPTANVDVTFTHAEKTAVARIKPLGQIERI